MEGGMTLRTDGWVTHVDKEIGTAQEILFLL